MKKLVLSLFILCTLSVAAFAQDRVVTGTVVSGEDGMPIPGASVRVKEATAISVATASDGKFSLRVPNSGKTLTITYLGFISTDVAIPASGNVGTVRLAVDSKSLNEVVITAGGVSIQRREQGNNSTTIKSEVLTQGKAFNVASALTGKVAGLQVNAVSSGVNPSVRVVLRGNRSLTGNNQALIVVDNVIVPTNILGNINPEDVEDIQVLNGAGAAALYGSDASNGAIIITTKTGKKGQSSVTIGQTTSLETVSYLPKVQERFGSGTTPDDVPTYTAYENQQYGPAFDGTMRDLGKKLADGSIQQVPYAWNESEGKNAFWDTGRASQTDFSITNGADRSSYYLSAQYFDQTGTVPGDKYNRFTIRLNGNSELSDKFNFGYNINYVQNRRNTGDGESAFNNVLMSPGQVPLTRYSDWKNDKYSTPDGYYNEYFDNPYFTLGNSRTVTRNDYLTGQVQLKFNPIKELSLLVRTSFSTRNVSVKFWQDKYTYSTYRANLSGSAKTSIVGNVRDNSNYETQINPEFQAQYIKKLSNDFSLNVIAGSSVRDNIAKNLQGSSSQMVTPGLYNISNTLGNTASIENNSRVRQVGVYGDARLGFKNYLYLHVTGRNDWRSVLDKEFRSLFYPAVDLSFIASDALSFLRESKTISTLKIRGGASRVGLVNLGAYRLAPTFSQQNGYPYAGVAGFGIGDEIVSPGIKPEITTSYEAGFDLEMFKSRVVLNMTAYQSVTSDQTVGVGTVWAVGSNSFLTNTGEVENKGIETVLRVVPVRTASGLEISVGGNYTYNQNEVLSISDQLSILSLGTFGTANLVAQKGFSSPMLRGQTYNRDPQGRIIVDRISGMPSVTTTPINLGVSEPKHRLGLDLTASYKNLRFATVFEYRQGNVVYTGASTGFDFSGAGIRTTYFNRERFVVPNSSYLDPATNTYVANTNITTRTGGADFWTNGPSNTAVNSNYTYSAAFWKMREASISYQLPKSVFGSVKFVKGAEISVQGRNLFLWAPKTNLYTDPEYSAFDATSNAIGFTSLGNTPPGRYYGLSLSLIL